MGLKEHLHCLAEQIESYNLQPDDDSYPYKPFQKEIFNLTYFDNSYARPDSEKVKDVIKIERYCQILLENEKLIQSLLIKSEDKTEPSLIIDENYNQTPHHLLYVNHYLPLSTHCWLYLFFYRKCYDYDVEEVVELERFAEQKVINLLREYFEMNVKISSSGKIV